MDSDEVSMTQNNLLAINYFENTYKAKIFNYMK